MKADFPSLADEIAEPHPNMNIKVAAFTVSEKSSNTSPTATLRQRQHAKRDTMTQLFYLRQWLNILHKSSTASLELKKTRL